MLKFVRSFRAGMILGKGHKHLQNGNFEAALERATKAKSLQLEEQFELLCHSIEGKSRFHLGDKEKALIALRKAEEVLAPMLRRKQAPEQLKNISRDITKYIEEIEHGNT